MALTLDPNLAAAQDSIPRKPLFEIIASSFAGALPLVGTPLSEDIGDSAPNTIMHSSGRWLGVYTRQTSAFKFKYTDIDRLSFYSVDISLPLSYVAVEATLCELVNGNVGLILHCTYGGYQRFLSMVVSPIGEIVVAQAEIFSYQTSAHVLASPFVRKLADNSYFLIYIDKTVSGGTYAFRKRTSADFASWSAEGTCSVGGLTSTQQIYSCSFLQISTGDLWLLFDYVTSVSGPNEIINVYYSISANGGSTWSSATNLTGYTDYSTVARHPIGVQKLANQLHVLFTDRSSIITMDDSYSGYCSSEEPPPQFIAATIVLDSVNRKLYCVVTRGKANPPSEHGRFSAVVRVDLATWTIDACWSTNSVPAFGTAWQYTGPFAAKTWGERNRGERHIIPVASNNILNKMHVAVLNGETDTITEYHFNAEVAHGIVQNVTWTPPPGTDVYLNDTWVDFNSMRLYCVFSSDNGSNGYVMWGYLDLTQAGPTYSFTTLYTDTLAGYHGRSQVNAIKDVGTGASFFVANDLLFVSAGICPWYSGSSGWEGVLHCYILGAVGTPGVWKTYRESTHSRFPLNGTGVALYSNGLIFTGFHYNGDVGEDWKKGLCTINPATDDINFVQPTWGTLNDYKLWTLAQVDGDMLVMNSYTYGITTYKLSQGTWVLYNNDSVPGMDGAAEYKYWQIVYDPAGGDLFFDGRSSEYILAKMPLVGVYKIPRYRLGTYAGSWSLAPKALLVQGYTDSELAACLENTDHTIHALWMSGALGSEKIVWGKEGFQLNITNGYLAKGREHSLGWSLDSPNELHFSVANGHLFDPDNLSSLLSPMLEKGRKITVRFGETVDGSDYWIEQGTFKVVERKLVYAPNEHPEMRVVAMDRRCTWDHSQIRATDYFDTDPKTILTTIANEHLDVPLSDIDLPVFDMVVPLRQQWMDSMGKDIVEQICHRFGYFPVITVDDKFSARKISNANPVDHTYSDARKLENFNFDDAYSDFTNQITVIGFDLNQIEILFSEERVGTLSGTIGWWKRKQDYNVYYSTDQSRRARYPRLAVIESGTSVPFQLTGKISESLSFVDPNELYCVVSVSGPDLVGTLVATIALIVLAYLIGDLVVSVGLGYTVPVGRLIQMIAINLIISILASVGNYQYEIWARPVGYAKQNIQATWNDLAMQNQIQEIVPKVITDHLSNTQSACQQVADREGMVIQMQRQTRVFSKIADLRDQVGDTMQVPHPQNGRLLKMFITRITRKIMVPDTDDGDGYFTDDLEVWRI